MTDTPAEQPTLSVILPTLRNRWRLGTQIEAVLSQLRPVDELIVLVQGEDEVDRMFRDLFGRAQVSWTIVNEPLGICGGYNAAAKMATKTHIAQLSGNDEWQPASVDAWLRAVTKFPDAKIFHGHVLGKMMLPWAEDDCFFPPNWLPAIWRNQGWQLHGSATIIRRDSWGGGYPPSLGYMADQFLAMRITMLHGAVYVRHKFSYVNWLPSGVSQAHGVQVSRDREKAEFIRLLQLPENAKFYEQWQIFDRITNWSKED